MGMDLDLDVALQRRRAETIEFLREHATAVDADAYSLSSVGIDFRVAEAVDAVQMVYGVIPKKIFKSNSEYWGKQ